MLDRTIQRKTSSELDNIEIPLAPLESCASEENWYTIIIGRNGTGKSRLLSKIAEAFSAHLGDFRTVRFPDANFLIKFQANGREEVLDPEKIQNDDRITKHTHDQQKPGPAKVIASTITPFDKFKLSKDVIRERMPARLEEGAQPTQIYHYAGLRDSNGRTNFQASLFRAIKGIFSGNDVNSRRLDKLTDVFHFLGYDPAIEIVYSGGVYSTSREIINHLLSDATNEEIIKEYSKSLTTRRLEYFFKTEPDARGILREALLLTGDNINRGGTDSIVIELASSDNERKFLNSLFVLKDLRLVSFRDVRLLQSHGRNSLSVMDASSGEISIVAGMLGIAAGISDNSLILIDEPEISLHPEWQDKYLDLLRSTFSSFKGCHFIIATHSPLILSDIVYENSNVLNVSSLLSGEKDEQIYSGASSDKLLATAFGVAGNNNLFIKQEAIRAANAAAKGDTSSLQFREKLIFLAGVREILPVDSNISKLIDDLLEAVSGISNDI